MSVYEQHLETLKNEYDKWAEWLHERRTEFVTAMFLQRGYRRFGKVISNAANVVNFAKLPMQSMAIVSMMEGMIQYQRDKYLERQIQSVNQMFKNIS